MSDAVIAQARKSIALHPAYVTFGVLWLTCVGLLFARDAQNAVLALAAAAYALILGFLAVRLLPKWAPRADDTTLRADGSRSSVLARSVVVAAVFGWVIIYGVAWGGITGGIYVPHLTPFIASMRYVRTPLHDSVLPLVSFTTYVLIPGVLLILLGADRRQLGLTLPVRGTGCATIACLALPIVMSAFAIWQGGISFAGLFWLLVHNLFSNGFSEEFLARGMFLSQLRAYVTREWALVGQAILFSLPHLGGTIPEEHGRVVLILANVIALNGPIAISLGIMALRSRSLVLPSLVHISLDTMGRLTSTM